MIVKENAASVLEAFTQKELTKELVLAVKLGVSNDNLMVTDVMLQTLLQQVFVSVSQSLEAEAKDFDGSQKAESCKKFLAGQDKRFGVGMDLICNHVLKNKRLWFKLQALSVNENANIVKFFEDKELEYAPMDEIVAVVNSLFDELNKYFSTEVFNEIKL